METITLEVGPNPRLRITSVEGDLRLTGREGTLLEAQAAPRAGLSVAPLGDGYELSCAAACLIFLPNGATVEGRAIVGDARITGLTGPLMLETVAGDLSLRRVGPVRVERVGGDLAAHRLEGDLRVAQVGGDAHLDHVQGEVQLDAVGGDLNLSAVEGAVRARVSGDVKLELSPPPGSSCSVQAAGDLNCHLMQGAALDLRLRAGGDLDTRVPGTREQAGQDVHIRMEGAQATAELTAGGDLWVRLEGTEAMGAEAGRDLRAQIQAGVDAAIAQVEASLGALGGHHGFGAERIRERMRRAAERAQRRAERARERAEGGRTRWTTTLNLDPWSARKSRVSDQERLTVLQMLEQGVIGVDEAEKLLRALEGEG
ncbi:MAG: hypothetical protein AB1449_00605 [Chloroflexota bacterium]